MDLLKYMVPSLCPFPNSDLNGLLSVDEPSSVLDFSSVRKTLMHIVTLCLDSDPSLIPLSCKTPEMEEDFTLSEDGRDPDDFMFCSERQAKRICSAIEQAFDVEYAPEVIVADANLTALANRILLSKEILTT
jgi:phosphatidylethanolamine N-methyltransferase